jgi:hypothetical protein
VHCETGDVTAKVPGSHGEHDLLLATPVPVLYDPTAHATHAGCIVPYVPNEHGGRNGVTVYEL